MKIFVTGVSGQLGHDVMNELNKRGYEGIGSDIAPEYAGASDGTFVTSAPYVSMDITDKETVEKTITDLNPDVVVHRRRRQGRARASGQRKGNRKHRSGLQEA